MEDTPKDDEYKDEEWGGRGGGDMPESGENRFFMQTFFLSFFKSLEKPASQSEKGEQTVCITF